MVMGIMLLMSTAVFAEPGKVKVDGKLVDVDVIHDGYVMLINLKDYQKHFPCEIEKDPVTQEITVIRPYILGGGSRWGTFKIGTHIYETQMEGNKRVMDSAPQQIGDDVYIPIHILCLISKDIINYTGDGKYFNILTQDEIDRRYMADMEAAGSAEEHARRESHKRFLGDLGQVEQRWPSHQIDSMPMMPREGGTGNVLLFKHVVAPEVNRDPESWEPTGDHKQYGAFKIPLLKGSVVSKPDELSEEWFVEEVRQPYGLVILRVHPNAKLGYKGALEIAISRKADLDMALKGMREILSQCFDPAGVEKIIKQVKQISPMATESVDTYPVESKSLTTEVSDGRLAHGRTSRSEQPFAKVLISIK